MIRLRKLIILLAAIVFAVAPALANENPFSYLSLASNNSTLVQPGPQFLRSILVFNTTSTTYYLKVYDKVTAPTCGTDTPKLRIPIAPQTSSGGQALLSFQSLQFTMGIGFCLVANIADNDNTNAATGIAINFTLSAL